MLLCCFRDSSKSEKDEEGSRSGRRHKYRDEVGPSTVPGLAREDSSVSRLSAGFNEPGVILAPVTFHPVPSNYDSRQAALPQPYNRCQFLSFAKVVFTQTIKRYVSVDIGSGGDLKR